MSGVILPFKGVSPTIDPSVFIAPTAAVIGDVVIGRGSSIWFGCTVRGDVHEIRIGENTNVQDGTVVHVTGGKFGTYIGNGVTIGHNATIHACTIGDNAFIGMGATLMDGVVVEEGAMVAAGALVTPSKRVKSGELWGGSPAKLLRPLSQEDLDWFPISAEKYRKLSAEYK